MCAYVGIVFWICSIRVSARNNTVSVEPDLTKGEKPSGTYKAWTLGPTGAVGNIWYSRGHGTSLSRMIQIKKSPKIRRHRISSGKVT